MKKYIKENVTPEQRANIIARLKDISVEEDEFEIMPNGLVNVNSNVYIFENHLQAGKLGLNFGTVTGAFDCANSNILSLEGAPRKVTKKFRCNSTPNIKTLEGAPEEVGSDFVIHNTGITSLVGVSDIIKKIGGSFICDFNRIHEGGLGLLNIEGLKSIKNGVNNDPLPKAFQIISKYLGRAEDIFDCQSELIDADLEAFAEI